MGRNTCLFEIDPKSSYFALIRSHKAYAERVFVLDWRYTDPESYRRHFGEPGPEEASLPHDPDSDDTHDVIAIEQMLTAEPRLAENWVSLGGSGYFFESLFEFVAGNFDEDVRELAPIVVHGRDALASDYTPGEHVPSRWVDTKRCGRIGTWLGGVTSTMLKTAYREMGSVPDLHWTTAELERDHEAIADVVSRVRRVYAVAAEHEHVVVSNTD